MQPLISFWEKKSLLFFKGEAREIFLLPFPQCHPSPQLCESTYTTTVNKKA